MKIERLNLIIEALQKVKETNKLIITDENLFQKALDYYMFEEQEVNKDKRTNTINKTPSLATDKQKALLKRYGYNGNLDKISVREASQIIGSFMIKEGEQ